MKESHFTEMPTFVILFWLILFFLIKEKKTGQRFLIFFLTVTLVNYVIYWCYYNINYEYYYILDSLWVITSLSVFPLYYYYIRLLTIDKKIDYRWSWLLIPGIALGLFSTIVYILMSPEEIEILNNEILYHLRPRSGNYSTLINMQLLRTHLLELIFLIEVAFTVFYGLRHIRKFNVKVEAFYSDEKQKEILNMRVTLFFMLATSIVAVLSNVIVDKHFFNSNHYLLDLPSLAHSAVIFGMSYAGYRQTFSIRELYSDQLQTAEEVLDEAEKAVRQEKDSVLDDKQDELFERMEYLLNVEEIFKNADLRLNDLALMLGSNRTYVSQLINLKANTNFSDYINKHRIAYTKRMICAQENADLSLEDIALSAGFSSKSSFYRLFAKIEGTPPARYRKEHLFDSEEVITN